MAKQRSRIRISSTVCVSKTGFQFTFLESSRRVERVYNVRSECTLRKYIAEQKDYNLIINKKPRRFKRFAIFTGTVKDQDVKEYDT